MNILHLIETSEPGGAETVLANLACNLDGSRYRSVVVVLEEGWLTDRLRDLGVEYVVLENRRSYDPVFLWRLMKLVRQRKIDLLHSHEFMMTVYGSVAARLLGKPMIGTMHGKVYYPEKKRRIRMLRFAAALSSRIITVSEELNLFLNDLLKLQDDSKIVTLYNGISLDRYQPSESTAAVRKKFDLPHDTAVIGTVGSMIKVKGINYLLEAVAILKEEHPNLRLLIAGEGNQMDKLIAQSHDLGLTDEVRFLGFRNDVPDILDALDVYVCSSLSEGHSLSILEAMAMGKPIVATDVGGNPELVIPEANGILVAPQNPEAIAEAVSGLLEDRSRMMSMGEQSRRMVQQRFSLERMVSDYMDIYERYIGQ